MRGKSPGLVKQRFEQWRRHLEAQPHSGLSIREYCQRHGLAESSFGYRKRQAATTPGFVEVTSALRPAISGVEIVLGERLRVAVSCSFDDKTLARVVACLKELV